MGASRYDCVAKNGMVAAKYHLIGKTGIARAHDVNLIDAKLKSWGRSVGILKDPNDGLFHGGVYSLFTGFESMAIGY
jgi:hypothetical protein